jgi:hypothetical protein
MHSPIERALSGAREVGVTRIEATNGWVRAEANTVSGAGSIETSSVLVDRGRLRRVRDLPGVRASQVGLKAA